LLSPFGGVDFGLTFENDGLRAQATIFEKKLKASPKKNQ